MDIYKEYLRTIQDLLGEVNSARNLRLGFHPSYETTFPQNTSGIAMKLRNEGDDPRRLMFLEVGTLGRGSSIGCPPDGPLTLRNPRESLSS